MDKRNIPPDLKLIDYLDLAFTFTPCSSDSYTRAARFSLSTPGQETNAPKTPEIHHFKTSHTLLDITNESPKYRGPNKKTVKLIKSRIGGMISQAADKFTDCDASTKLQLYKELLKDKLQLEEELKQVKQQLDIAKKFKINNEKDTEMIDLEVKSLNEIGVQTIESRIKEDSSPKTFEILMKNYSNKNYSDLLDLHHYFFHFAKRMMNIEKCFLDLSSRQTKLTRTNDGYNMLCHLAAPRMPMDSLEAIEHRKTLILQIASKFDLKLQPENCMTPLEASLMMNKCRLSMRCYLKLRDLVTNYITLPSRHTIDKQTKDIDEIFKTTVRYVPFENDRILVTTVDNVREVITYRVQTLINHGNFQRMPSPWEKTIFLAEYYDKGGEHISVKLGVGLACSLFNSDPQRVTLVGGYHGDMKYMPACFRPVIKQLNGIKFIEVIIDGKVERFEIVRRFSSDTEGILQCHCRLSATSNTYCWNCNYAVKVGDRRLTFHECDGGYAGPPLVIK
uniref:Uncharacterized protein n=1 Tax=Panagrolaimus superbus TaxID=310955 RepID=A0A914YFV3_9BILA